MALNHPQAVTDYCLLELCKPQTAFGTEDWLVQHGMRIHRASRLNSFTALKLLGLPAVGRREDIQRPILHLGHCGAELSMAVIRAD